jgi:hypothetical protein
MNRLRLIAALLAATLAVPAFAYTDEGRLPYIGQPGQLPVEVATAFVKNRLGEDGHFEYHRLSIEQVSEPETFDRVELSVVRDGLLDDSLKAVRQRLSLHRNGQGLWQIDRIREDFACWRGRKGWGVKPCL